MPSAAGGNDNLGARYLCPNCGAKFYDLHRPVPSCPKCGWDARDESEKDAEPSPKKRPAIASAVARAAAKRAEKQRDEDEDEDDDD